MYGGGLVTAEEAEAFKSQYKYAALAYHNYQTVSYYNQKTDTDRLIAHVVGMRNKSCGCQRYSSMHIGIPADAAQTAPDRGVIFYHNAKQVAAMNGYDVDEFARIFGQMVETGEKEMKSKERNNEDSGANDHSNGNYINTSEKPLLPLPGSSSNKKLPRLPMLCNNSKTSCCLIL
ncbi:hypothetical protein IWW48_000903 [Coemansia sp. RSA 1200]|nr:hypothetical protein IWW48_000903 [Coemansia sp. RSA 1200]